jgi:hypothetical protein
LIGFVGWIGSIGLMLPSFPASELPSFQASEPYLVLRTFDAKIKKNTTQRISRMLTPRSCFRKSKDFVFRQIDEETILVPIKNNVGDMGCLYTLNEVGAFVWGLIDGHKTIEEIHQCLLKEFDVSADKAIEDLKQFVNQLESIEAVIPNPDSPRPQES